MGFTNSPLVVYTNLSPNFNVRTQPKITKITVHHTAGVGTAKRYVDGFANKKRGASANYCIGYQGEIGMSVEEKNRPWTSSSSWNDQRAVTIEASNDQVGGNWHVSDATVASIINLCVDICQRNAIPGLVYDGTKNGSYTWHCMFAATACPGPYLKQLTPYIVQTVNERLAISPTPTPIPSGNPYPKPTSPVKSGATGNNVKWIQFQLNYLGYCLIVDGNYGQATTNSVADFQSKNKLSITGNCDMKTINALDAIKPASSFIYGGIDYCHTFDPVYYGSKYADLAATYGTDVNALFNHYIKFGIKEMRQACATFNVQIYAANYPDLRNAFGPLNSKTAKQYVDHYNTFGYKEGRIAI